MSNLLEKASIVTTPTAYDNGKILSVKPAPSLSSELVTNGGFDTDSNWNKINSTISGGAGNLNGTGVTSMLYQNILTNGKTYKVTFTVSDYNSLGEARIIESSGSAIYTITSNGTFTFTFTHSNADGNFLFRARTGAIFSIDNVSVKEAIDGDFDFTRNSSATRVNSQGLIEDVQILSSNLVSNGDFSQEGSELIANGDFATDSDWNKDNSWSINNDTANYNYISGRNMNSSTASLVVGKTYKLVYTLLDYVSGSVENSSAETQIQRNSNGTYTEYFIARFTFLRFRGSSGGEFSIDNVSVKEVGQDWTLDSSCTIELGKANFLSSTSNAPLYQSSPYFTIGKTYKITYTVSNYSAGRINWNDFGAGAGNGIIRTANGTYTDYYSKIGTSTNFGFQTQFGFTGSITNISIIEITEDTNLPRINYEGFSYQDALGSELVVNGDFATDSNWSKSGQVTIGGGVAYFDSDGTFTQIAQTLSGISGENAKVVIEVTEYNQGTLKVLFSGGAQQNLPTSVGTHTLYFSNVSSNTLNIARVGGVTDIKIDNVSVKEVIGQEVVPDSGCGSWLFEPQSTNLVIYSQNYNTGWNRQSGNISDGGSGLFYLSPLSNVIKYQSTTVGFNQMQYSLPSAVTIGTTYTQQGYVKCDDAPYIHFQIHPISGSTFVVWDNINNVVVSASASIDSYNITSLNGWIKAEITYTATVASIYASIKTYFSTSPTSNQAGIPIGTIAYQTFAQVEASSYATSYIPTSGEVNGVTRLQDAAFGAGSSDLINSTEGVLYAEIASFISTDATEPNRYLTLTNGTSNQRIALLFGGNNNQLRAIAYSNTQSINLSFSTSLTDTKQFNKLAIKYKSGDYAFFLNGIKIGGSTEANIFTADTLNDLSFNVGGGTQEFRGKVKCVAVFKEALTDAELTCLTTI